MILLLYPLLCIAVAYVAGQKGRSGLGWFLLSMLLSPVLGIILVAVLPSQKPVHASLESQVRDSMLETRYSSYIKTFQPVFSHSVTHEVTFTGERRRFKKKADAIAFCMLHLPSEAQGLTTAQPPSLPAHPRR